MTDRELSMAAEKRSIEAVAWCGRVEKRFETLRNDVREWVRTLEERQAAVEALLVQILDRLDETGNA